MGACNPTQDPAAPVEDADGSYLIPNLCSERGQRLSLPNPSLSPTASALPCVQVRPHRGRRPMPSRTGSPAVTRRPRPLLNGPAAKQRVWRLPRPGADPGCGTRIVGGHGVLQGLQSTGGCFRCSWTHGYGVVARVLSPPPPLFPVVRHCSSQKNPIFLGHDGPKQGTARKKAPLGTAPGDLEAVSGTLGADPWRSRTAVEGVAGVVGAAEQGTC